MTARRGMMPVAGVGVHPESRSRSVSLTADASPEPRPLTSYIQSCKISAWTQSADARASLSYPQALGNRPAPGNILPVTAEAWTLFSPQPSPVEPHRVSIGNAKAVPTDCQTHALPADGACHERHDRRRMGAILLPASNVVGRTKPDSRPDCAAGVTTRLDLQGASQAVHDGSDTGLMTHKTGSRIRKPQTGAGREARVCLLEQGGHHV